MANDRFYRPGDYYQIDDVSGFKIRKSRSLTQWDGIVTAPESFSPRQPQDLVVGVRDSQAVEQPRPRQPNQFVVLGSWVVAFSPRLSTTLTVADAAGMQVGDYLQIMLDSGENFFAGLVGISGNTLTVSYPLSESVGGAFGDPIENTVIDLGPVSASNLAFILDVPGRDILDYNLLG